MFKFLKPGIEFNNLAKSLNAINFSFQDIDRYIDNGDDFDYELEISIAAYIFRKGVLDRMNEYNWPTSSKIVVPAIEKGRITLLYAFNTTNKKLLHFANIFNLENLVDEIIEKKIAYYQIEQNIPSELSKII